MEHVRSHTFYFFSQRWLEAIDFLNTIIYVCLFFLIKDDGKHYHTEALCRTFVYPSHLLTRSFGHALFTRQTCSLGEDYS